MHDHSQKLRFKSAPDRVSQLKASVQSGLMMHVVGSSGSQLQAALLANAMKLSKVAAASLPADWNLVQVEMAATNFSALSAAAAPSIRRFLQMPMQKGLETTPQQPNNTGGSATGPPIHEALPQQSCNEHEVQNAAMTNAAPKGQGRVQSLTAQTISPVVQQAEVEGMHQTAIETDLTAFSRAEIQQQQQMFREHEARQRMNLRQSSAYQAGSKRTHDSQNVPIMSSKSGQQTILGIFSKAPRR